MIDMARVEKRVRAMSEGELLTWLEVAIPGMQRHLEAYQRSRNADHLGELALAETTANIVITELLSRKFAAQEELAASVAQDQPATTSAPRRFLRGRRGKTGAAPVQRTGTSE